MKCPACPDATLVMADRTGVEIDYCPTCRGVWLDRGELDKIIDRMAVADRSVAAPARPGPSSYPAPAPAFRDDDDDDDDDDRRYGGDRYGKPKKRKSLLGELFDF